MTCTTKEEEGYKICESARNLENIIKILQHAEEVVWSHTKSSKGKQWKNFINVLLTNTGCTKGNKKSEIISLA